MKNFKKLSRDKMTADHLKHHKNGFSIVINDENNEELESLTGNGSRFLNGARNFVSASVSLKLYAVLIN